MCQRIGGRLLSADGRRGLCKDGWLHTGDLARGLRWLLHRRPRQDMIVTGSTCSQNGDFGGVRVGAPDEGEAAVVVLLAQRIVLSLRSKGT